MERIINYPVVFFVFKRPSITGRFLSLMKEAGIKKVYVFADGPRNSQEKVLTDQVRDVITEFADNNRKLDFQLNYSSINRGLKKSIISGLNQVFVSEKAAIILEDDCLPIADFFKFTAAMLSKYEDNKQIMSVNGSSPGGNFDSSYAFTKYPQCWGWATWARAWKLYDSELTNFDGSNWNKIASNLGFGRLLSWYWKTMLTIVKAGQIDTWDFQWSFAHFVNNSLAISPSSNLISNIGFDSAATNTKTKTAAADKKAIPLSWPLKHPENIIENSSIARSIESHFYTNPIAILGLIRQYIYWKLNYGHRT